MDLWLVTLCLSRVFLYANFMVVAASIPVLVNVWDLSATEAGSVVSAFTLAYSASLFVFSWASDHFGARHMSVISGWASAAAALAFGFFARDYWSALLFYGLAGAFQGGVYTPLIMVLADRTPPERRGTALGWLIASTSIGYAVSIGLAGWGLAGWGLAGWGLATGSYEMAFMLTGVCPLFGAILLHATLWNTPNHIHPKPSGIGWFTALRRNADARRLVIGYTAHSWELLGAWAWTPALLAASLMLRGSNLMDSAVLASSITVVLHLSGAVSAYVVGRLSDRLGRRPVLVEVGLLGGGMSLGVGWLVGLPLEVLAIIVVVHNVLLLGDSPVLTTAVTERVEPGHLGAVLAIRALFGFGAGALAAVAFGAVLDGARAWAGSELSAWGPAYMLLGAGGLLAAFTASRLPRLKTPVSER